MVENLPANAGDTRDMGLIPESGRSSGGGNGNPLCRSPAPVDPGNLKRGQSRHLGKDYLIRNIKRLGKNSVVGNLEKERGCIPWFT